MQRFFGDGHDQVDLLVLDETISGRLTHAVALLGELRHPYISTILMTDRQQCEMDELYDLIPSLYAMAGCDVPVSLLGRLAIAAVDNVDEAQKRVARHQAADLAEAALDDVLPEWLDDIECIDDFADEGEPKPDPVAAMVAAIAEPAADEILILTEKDKAVLPYFGHRPLSRPAAMGRITPISRIADSSLALQ